MKDIELLLPRVLEKAAACPEPTAIRHLRDAAIEFCRRTRVWRETEEFVLGADECETVATEETAVLFEISHARFSSGDCEGVDLEPVTMDWLDANEPGWRDRECEIPRYITQSAPDTVRLVPAPPSADDNTITLELILIPSNTTDQVPDVLIDSYSRQIADGALGGVLLIPGDFYNAPQGAYHKQEFETALGRFGASVPRGQQRSRRKVRARFF